MVVRLFSMYDKKSRCFGPPQAALNQEVMARKLAFECESNPDSLVKMHAEDYDIYYLGDYDDHDAAYHPVSPPELLFNLMDLLQGMN